MITIEWKDEYSVGVPAIDHEHRELIDLINWLNEIAHRGVNYDKVRSALGEIYTQISAHFALEEKIMRDARYEHFGSHKDDHEKLLDELRDIMDRVDRDGRYDEDRLSRELEQWFSVHFQTHDARLHKRLG
ncbi:MAG: bacteriohemerythrin [Woeseiaceae bacterium]|nr:bacteriohemerythrin [Woeseiaceae bacterium]